MATYRIVEDQPEKETAPVDLSPSVMVDRSAEVAAPATRIAGASFIDSPIQRIAYYAKQRFPDLSADEAFNRYSMLPDGTIVYRKDDGSYAAEVPQGWAPGAILKRAATGVGATVSGAPAMATGIATAPMMVTGGPAGIAGSITATGAAGAAGEAVRQGIGNYLADDPVSVGDIAKEAAWSAGGQGLGEAITYAIGKRLAHDFSQYNPANTAQLVQKGARAGVELTLPEASNLPSLKFRQQVVSEMPGGSDRMGEFYSRRAGQTDAAMDNFLKTLSANDSTELAGLRAKGAAFEAIEKTVKQRADAARPLYEAAFKNFQGLPAQYIPEAEALMKRPSMRQAAERAARLAADEGINLADPAKSLQGMHYMQQALRDMAGEADSGMKGTEARTIRALRDRLLRIMDDASPKDSKGQSLYSEARSIYAANSPAVEAAKDPSMSLVGFVSGLGDRKAADAYRAVLDPKRSGPLAMSQFKRAVQAVDPEAWQQIKRAYLQDVWAEAGQRFATGQPYLQPAKFAAAMMSPKQRQMLQEAFSPQEMAAFNDLMEVFEATGRGLPRNSTTVPKGVEMRRMEREAGGIPALAARAGQVMSPGRWAEWIEEARLGKHADKIAQIITDPNAQNLLKQLKQVSPNEARFSALLGQLLARGARNSADAMLQ